MRTHVKNTLLIGLLALGTAAAAHAQSDSCPELRRLIDAALPAEVGDQPAMAALLAKAAPSRTTQVTFEPCRALTAIDQGCQGFRRTCKNSCTDGPFAAGDDCSYVGPAGQRLRVRGAAGRYKYLNAERGFDPSRDPDNRVADADAYALARRVAVDFGIPAAELDEQRNRVAALQLFSSDPDKREVQRMLAEKLVLFGRQIGGTPVFGSEFKASINHRSEVARLHMNWPTFGLAPRLDAANTRLRSAVADEISAKLLAEGDCGSIESIEAKVVYAPSSGLASTDGGDDSAAPTPARAEFAPALAIAVTAKFDPTGVGGYSNSLELFTLPLLNTDGDFDDTVRAGDPPTSDPPKRQADPKVRF